VIDVCARFGNLWPVAFRQFARDGDRLDVWLIGEPRCEADGAVVYRAAVISLVFFVASPSELGLVVSVGALGWLVPSESVFVTVTL
jgi:hypothetical protein